MGDTSKAATANVIARDEERLVRLLTEVAPRAYRAAAAILRDSHLAEDAVQEGSIVAFQSIEQLRDDEAFRAWFTRIVVNKAIDIFRKRRREQERFEALVNMPDIFGGRSIDKEAAMDVAKAVEQLPVNHRTVIQLYYSGGYTTPEIAKLLDKPEGTIRRFLSEAYKMLRISLGPRLHDRLAQ
jgi:RNA polymerase sigma-70 factor (ECF subfamily)